MRYICLVTVCVLVVSFFCACSKKEEPEYVISLPDADFSISIEEETIKDHYNTVVLRYPVVSDYDVVKAETVNGLVREFSLEYYQKQALASDQESYYYYEITDVNVTLATEGFYSAVILGEYMSSSGNHPEYISYTVNADLKSGVLFSTEQLLKNESAVRKLFIEGAFRLEYGNAGLIADMSFSDMIVQYRVEYGIYPDIFFKEGFLGINIELPYVLGGHAGYVINVIKISDALRDGEIKDLLTTDIAKTETT